MAEITTDLLFQSNMNVVIAAMAIPIGLSNTYTSFTMVRREGSFIFKLNLGQATILFLSKSIQCILVLLENQNCSFAIHLAAITYYVSTLMIEIILITKAYYANMRSKSIAACGATIELARFVVHVLILLSIKSVGSPLGSCFSMGTDLLFTLLISAEGCLVIFLSAAFIGSLMRVSKVHSGAVYNALIKDGFIYVFSICGVITLIILLIVTGVAPPINGYFLDMGWAISSLLMTEQLRHSHHRHQEHSQAFSANGTNQLYNDRTTKSCTPSFQTLTREDVNEEAICLETITPENAKPIFS
ncbi:hypothetical protein K493DRAFT_313757 [Basidiobolus meristosporus CBS 931.73]|uniref:Uncharacterized protein n=1 Tax=Basidiobolus meristosporus CBS 931.73 TaxID=1314790 RepID=A0A1Y1YJK0_9FUNG|nr:hypothetical protein K493DRAFT_313757 [Basidiobolus meristosporus CBS 931.73]|eukprot:ORX98138.1 hypothetical protein K493DRAFT_313757 [Basidiobolus meristosporus CBS 931.73]